MFYLRVEPKAAACQVNFHCAITPPPQSSADFLRNTIAIPDDCKKCFLDI
jgi:hypothetical protein